MGCSMPSLRTAPVAIAVSALALGVASCGGSSSDPGSQPQYLGSVATPRLPAPALHLRDSRGKPIDIRDYRGKAVMVTFIYTHCPDTCPLIVGHLHTALAQLGPRAHDLQTIAVSVDPKGDTPKTVN